MAIRDAEGAPVELVAQCETINKNWMSSTDAHCEPYFHSSDFGDEWRICIKDTATGIVLVDCLAANNVGDGHSLMLMMNAVRKAWQAGVIQGKGEAAFALLVESCKTVGVKLPVKLDYHLTGFESNKKFY